MQTVSGCPQAANTEEP
ncbi:hypothetical protein CJF30_00001812 [Rutstroemia sp. NJR-2017a BBW]|nr:hypothetical protein CJF30_00001811 [Rutstroemia sp. NJR-2017a BBW]PQE20494.1 hypothetical protein CJF30_00001812 [Rutstroemia sp. NJR-2017a BBW]